MNHFVSAIKKITVLLIWPQLKIGTKIIKVIYDSQRTSLLKLLQPEYLIWIHDYC